MYHAIEHSHDIIYVNCYFFIMIRHGAHSPVLEEDGESSIPPNILPSGVHRMRAPRSVRFHSSVLNNEDAGKKKSNACCIYRHSHDECDETRNNYERL
jgi:Protein phosphatase inhibitor